MTYWKYFAKYEILFLEPYIEFVRKFQVKQAIELINGQDYAGALAILEKLIKLDPKNSIALGEAGFCLGQTGNFAKAKEKLELAVGINPADGWIWQYYGYILYKLGMLTASISALKESIKYNIGDFALTHQLAFLYYQNKDYENALNTINKAQELFDNSACQNLRELMNLKAMIIENINKDQAIQEYLALIELDGTNPVYYDRLSILEAEDYISSENLLILDNNDSKYNTATQMLRHGHIDNAIESYNKIIVKSICCYPAYLGISQALYEKKFGIKKLRKIPSLEGINKFIKNYYQLNENEKNILNASISPLKNFLHKLEEKGVCFTIVPIETKLVEYPQNRHLADKIYLKSLPYSTLRGIGGEHAFVGVERLRDFLWSVTYKEKFIPACIAHEYAHQVWCLLDKSTLKQVKDLYKEAKLTDNFISNYSKASVEEYFAEYYAYFARLIAYEEEIFRDDPMIKIFISLQKYEI